jgi:integrase
MAATPEHRRLIRTDVPGVYRRGRRYVAITRYRGRLVKTYHRTKSEAKEAKARRDAGDRPTAREPFARYAERWLVEYRGRTAKGLAPTTREDYAYLIREYAIPFFDRKAIGDIGPLDVKQFIEHLATLTQKRRRRLPDGTVVTVRDRSAPRLSPASIRRIVAPLKALLAEAYELELLPSNPAKVRVVVPGERSRRSAPKHMTTEEVAAVLAELSDRDRLLFTFLSRTGVRISEALGAKWKDIEQTDDGPIFQIRRQRYRGELREEAKTEAGSRAVALLPSVMRDLLRHRTSTLYPADDDPIFPTITGTHQDAHNVRNRLRPAARAAGVHGPRCTSSATPSRPSCATAATTPA